MVLEAVLLLLQEEDAGARQLQGLGKVHLRHQLSEEQLEEMRERLPSLRESDTYVRERLCRMHPPEHVDLGQEEVARDAYLTRVNDFAASLGPKFTHLTLFALYHRLAFAVRAGRFDTDLFLRYLAVPRRDRPFRSSGYGDLREQHLFAALDRLPAAELALPPPTPSDDAALCVQFLERLAEETASAQGARDVAGAWGRVEGTPAAAVWERVAQLVEDRAVDEARFRAALHAVQSSEELSTLLTCASPEQRREAARAEDVVEITFSAATPAVWSPQDRVELDVRVKNVDELLIKVFEINTTSFYREARVGGSRDVSPRLGDPAPRATAQTGAAIRTNMSLDGLVPSHQRTASCKAVRAVPLARVRPAPPLTPSPPAAPTAPRGPPLCVSGDGRSPRRVCGGVCGERKERSRRDPQGPDQPRAA